MLPTVAEVGPTVGRPLLTGAVRRGRDHQASGSAPTMAPPGTQELMSSG
jgi:hypothetical protein